MTKPQTPVITLKTAHELAFSPSDNRLAFIGRRDVTVLDVRNRKTVFAVHPIPHSSHIDFSPDGRRLAVKGTSGQTIILDARTGRVLSDFRNQKEGEGGAALFSRCGRFVISISWEGVLSVRDWATTEITHSQSDSDCQFDNLSTTAHRTLFVWSVSRAPRTKNGLTPSTVAIQRWPIRNETPRELPTEWSEIWGLRLSPSGRFLAIVYGTPPNTLEIFDIARLRPIARRDWSGSPGCSIAWSRNEKTLVVNGDGNFRVYGVPKLTVLRELPVEYPCFVQFSHSEEFLALGSWKKSFIIPTDFLDEFEKSKKRIHPSSRRAAH